MRNSFLPLALLLLTIGASLWLIRGGPAQGSGGPAVFPGIFKLPARDKHRTPSAPLEATNRAEGAMPADAASWRVILVSGRDDQPLTNAVLLALGEELTHRGCIAIMDPRARDLPAEPLPLGADGVLRVATRAGDLPVAEPGPVEFTATIDATPVRVPADHPAARWFPDLPTSTPSTFTLTHSSRPAASTGWPAWYAAIGRAVADAALTALGTPADGAADTAVRVQRTAWILPGQQTADSPFGRIPAPPQGDVVEELMAFQHPFVRGWIGRLSPVPVATRDGGTRPARDELVRRLERGTWVVAGDSLWTKDDIATDGTVVHRNLTIRGSQVIEWQERPSPTTLWQAWQKANLIEQLDRHRTTAGIPADLR